MEELNKKTLLENELSKHVDVAPQVNLYVPRYVRDRTQKLESSYNKLIEFIKTKGYSCFYFNKYDFIARDEEGQLYLNENAFKDALDKIFNKYTNFDKEHIAYHVERGCETLLKTNLRTNAISGLHVIVPNMKLQIVMNYNIPDILPELTIFSELCYCLQAIYDNEIFKAGIYSEKELQPNEQNKKNIFLERYRSRTQTLLFASLIILLNNKENPKFEDLTNNLINQNLYYPAKSGWLVYPLLQEEIKNIKEKPNEYDKFNTQEQSIDYQELYKYSMEKVKKKYADYQKFLSGEKTSVEEPKNLKHIQGMSFLSDEKTSVEELICKELLQITQNVKLPGNLLSTFNKIISDLMQDIANKTTLLEQCKKRLEPIKAKTSEQTLNNCLQESEKLEEKVDERIKK